MKKNLSLLENRLAKYSLTASAVLVLANPLSAQISGIDVDENAEGDLTVGESLDINFAGGNVEYRIAVGGSDSCQWIRLYGSASMVGDPRTHSLWVKGRVRAKDANFVVSSLNDDLTPIHSQGFAYINMASYSSTSFGTDFVGSQKYIAVRFNSDGQKYGWIRVQVIDHSHIKVYDYAYNTAGNSITCDGILPVELTNFTAVQFENTVKLLWETATEVNNYGFEIQRSANSVQQSVFETLGFVEGHGNSNSPKYYEFIDDNAPADNLEYRLKQIDTDGNYEYYSLTAKVDNNVTDVQDNSLPLEFALNQNYPNPFNPSTAISYTIGTGQLSAISKVELKVFDLLGKEVATLVNKEQATGNYSVNFDASNLPSGMYIYRITADEFIQSRKMLLIK